MKFRAKLRLQRIMDWGNNYKEFFFACEYSNNPEDNSFSTATPNGQIQLAITNQEVVKTLEIGKVYFVDFTPVE